jgi:hypothetical protein
MTGYRFSHSRQDAAALGGVLTVHVIVVAESRGEARRLVCASRPGGIIELVGEGETVLKIAHRLGIPDRQPHVL